MDNLVVELTEKDFKDVDGIVVPGGFGDRGIDGKLLAIQYARENKVPFLGIGLGMQCAVIEFARNVLGYADANSTEMDEKTTHPVIDLMEEQKAVLDMKENMRLGSYECVLTQGNKVFEAYGKEHIQERHRHRYEVNQAFKEQVEKGGLVISGTSPDGELVEFVESKNTDFFIATQGHPEYRSRPYRAHPLFEGLVRAASKEQKGEKYLAKTARYFLKQIVWKT